MTNNEKLMQFKQHYLAKFKRDIKTASHNAFQPSMMQFLIPDVPDMNELYKSYDRYADALGDLTVLANRHLITKAKFKQLYKQADDKFGNALSVF